MIIAYHRPDKLAAALELLSDPMGNTVPMGGGTVLNRPGGEMLAIVDLQGLALNVLEKTGRILKIGATSTLQELLQWAEIPAGLAAAIQAETNFNLRQVATVAGTLVSATGRSTFATAMLALDANLTLLPGDETIGLSDCLATRPDCLRGRLISKVTIPANIKFAYQAVARTPEDLPIVCVAIAQWPSGRTRVALGGYGTSPLLAMDGPEPGGVELAARNAFHEAADQWASAAYRADVAATLARRALTGLA